MIYSKHLSQSLRCHRHFFHSSFYSSFSYSWEKYNVIFLHCNRNTRLNKIEADDSNCTGIYCIFISWLVWFPLWIHRKKENWRQIFIFHFSEKNKIWHRFSFLFFYVQKKIKIEHRFSFVIFHFSISKKIKIELKFPFFIFLCLEKNENWKSIVDFSFFIFKFKKIWKLDTDFHFSFFNLQKKWMTLKYTHSFHHFPLSIDKITWSLNIFIDLVFLSIGYSGK